MENRAPIMVDGEVVGYLSLSWSEEIPVGEGLPPSVGLAGMSAASSGPGVGQQTVGGAPHHQRRLGGAHHGTGGTHRGSGERHHRYLDPANRADQNSRESAAHEKHGPTFRHGITPRGAAEAAKPEHLTLSEVNKAVAGHEPEKPKTFSTADVQSAVKGGSGLKGSRARFEQELKDNPSLRERITHISMGENGNPTANRAVIESAMNRASMMGTSLDREMRRTSEGGYYAGWAANPSAKDRAMVDENIKAALSGSNVNNYATDNSSQGLHVSGQNPLYRRTRDDINGEHFSVPNRAGARGFDKYNAWRKSVEGAGGEPTGIESLQRNMPRGVTRLSAGETPKAESTFANTYTGPGGMTAPNGQPPSAFIVHHTAGRGTAADVVHGWENDSDPKRHGVGTQYIMDREGVVHDVAKEFGGTHKDHRGQGHFLNSVIPGVSNRTAVGMEIIAKNDADITAKQRENAIKFINSQFQNTTPYGHSEVSPSDRTNEGVDIARTIRQMREKK